MHVAVRAVSTTAPQGWNERTVSAPGGNVMQGTCWAEQRVAQGGTAVFVEFSDGRAALFTTRPARPVGTFAAARKGPIHAGDPGDHVAARAAALARVARDHGASELFVDPELDRSDVYERDMQHSGFRVTDEAQPSIHVMRLELPAGGTVDELLATFAKSTRQRIHTAQQAGVEVSVDPLGARLPEFAELLGTRSEDLGVQLRPEFGSLPFSERLLKAGQARLYLADHHGTLLGGLLVYLQGGTASTTYSADRADRRREFPGVMHLLRWRLLRDCLEAGMRSVDLGGVDLPGHRMPPSSATEPTWGLYEHKRSFGAVWVEREPARRIVLRPSVDRLNRAARRLRSVGRGSEAAA